MSEIAVMNHLKTAFTESSATGERSIDTLAAAAHTGRIAKVRSMIEEGIEKSAKSEYFGSPLEAAASGGHIGIVLLLLENGFDALTWLVSSSLSSRCSCCHDEIATPLLAASRAGHENIVRLLSDLQYESEDSQFYYQDAALDAATTGHARIVEFLLDRMEIARRPRLQDRILLTASEHGHEVIVQWVLDLGTPTGVDLFDVDQPIHRAAARGHDNVVQLLLARGAKLVRGEYGFPLHEAARGGFVKIAQMLIDHGANIDAVAAPRRTPIASAAESGNVQMVRFLIEKGADLCIHGGGPMALCYAARDCQETIVRLLTECGVHVDTEDDELGPMLKAILEGHDQAAKALVELGAKRVDPLETKLVKERAHCLATGKSLRTIVASVCELTNASIKSLFRQNRHLLRSGRHQSPLLPKTWRRKLKVGAPR